MGVKLITIVFNEETKEVGVFEAGIPMAQGLQLLQQAIINRAVDEATNIKPMKKKVT